MHIFQMRLIRYDVSPVTLKNKVRKVDITTKIRSFVESLALNITIQTYWILNSCSPICILEVTYYYDYEHTQIIETDTWHNRLVPSYHIN